jgi:hypothetical protein
MQPKPRNPPHGPKPTKMKGGYRQLTTAGPGRPKGGHNKVTLQARELAVALVNSSKYLGHVKRQMEAGTLHPALQVMLWHYAFGKPKETVKVEGGPSAPQVVFYIPDNHRGPTAAAPGELPHAAVEVGSNGHTSYASANGHGPPASTEEDATTATEPDSAANDPAGDGAD